ncbi:MAG: SulP family inorganic anion transporter [Saprospiraceae bacterium]|nr:SulP family inorganic anion transporter [Saprospiraceae bacterium]
MQKLVVFLVALPLCLGIALASGAPLFAGIISGLIGGIVVGFLSNSHVCVTGPAAGLTAIVLSAIGELGQFQLFLTAVVLAGVIQFIFGLIKAGVVANYFPNNVIEGMLAGIGVIIFLKQIPHAVGYDKDAEGDMYFVEKQGGNTISSLFSALENIQPGAVIITLFSLSVLLLWDRVSILKRMKLIPGALIAVVGGILLNFVFISLGSSFAISGEHLVTLPVMQGFGDITSILAFPEWAGLADNRVWVIAVTIAVVASIETLLCIEAGDRLDSQKRFTSANNELKAQGIGNILSGLIGGLPMTSVVVRTTANIQAGSKTKASTILHGLMLLVSVLAIPTILNQIPLATLAAILLLIGYKLASPSKIRHFWSQGKYQFVPFLATLLAVVFIDLLKGVAVGMVISFVYVLLGNAKRGYFFRKEQYSHGDVIHLDLTQEVSFLNKASIKQTLVHLPEGSNVVINATNTFYIAHDILDLIREFRDIHAIQKDIKLELVGFKQAYNIENSPAVENRVWIESKIIES